MTLNKFIEGLQLLADTGAGEKQLYHTMSTSASGDTYLEKVTDCRHYITDDRFIISGLSDSNANPLPTSKRKCG